MRRSSFAVPAFALLALAASAHAAVTPAELAQRRTVFDYLTARAAAGDLHASVADVAELAVTDQYRSAHNGVSHLYLRQTIDGLEVDGTEYGVHLDRRGQVFYTAGSFVDRLAERAAESIRTPFLTADEAVVAAAGALGLAEVDGLGLVSSDPQARDQRAVFVNRGLSRVDIPVRLRYLRDRESDAVRLAWNLSIQVTGGSDWWDTWIDAETGALLRRDNWTADAETYSVFEFPNESPIEVDDRTDVVDPYTAGGLGLPDGASPFGWHDTDGIAGAEFTTTRGNNVRACDDINNNDNCAGAIEPDGTAALLFTGALVPLDLENDQPADYTAAAVVSLFYWNNIVHDVAYQYGFNEASGNFQVNNYGRGGLGADSVNADAQDGSGTNNANFGTPADGLPPRMQMYRWSAPQDIHETAPDDLHFPAGAAATGWGFSPPFDVPGDLVFVNDGEGDPNDGCCSVTNPATGLCVAPSWGVTGKIALVRRGLCEFGVKGLNAEVAGALGTIIINNGSNGVAGIGPGVSGAAVTKPVQMIGKANGDGLVAALGGGPVTVTMSSTAALPDRDSDFDAGVIAHEYGHGISNRLTGGPANVGCLGNVEQAGEGWSDWQALFLFSEESDTATTERSIGGYVSFEPIDAPGFIGIRRYAYTTDMVVNPLTYAGVGDVANSQPHGIGTIWATTLWEAYWNLVAVDGYDPDIYYGDGGNNVIYQLVLDGMKLQACSPSFVDARNAILAADVAAYEGDHECELWRAFAKRGLGELASTGAHSNDRIVTQSFAVPAQCGPTAIFSSGFGHGDLSHWTSVP